MTAEDQRERADLVRELEVMTARAEWAENALALVQADVREAISDIEAGFPRTAICSLRKALGA